MNDRIRIASVCLFFSALLYAGIAWFVYERAHGPIVVAAAAAAFALAIYVVMGVFAVALHRWAWMAALLVFGLNIAAAMLLWHSPAGWGLCALGAVGLWACLSARTKSVFLPKPSEPEPVAAEDEDAPPARRPPPPKDADAGDTRAAAAP